MDSITRYKFIGKHSCPKGGICIEQYYDNLDKNYKFFELKDSFFEAKQVKYCRKCGCKLRKEG